MFDFLSALLFWAFENFEYGFRCFYIYVDPISSAGFGDRSFSSTQIEWIKVAMNAIGAAHFWTRKKKIILKMLLYIPIEQTSRDHSNAHYKAISFVYV